MRKFASGFVLLFILCSPLSAKERIYWAKFDLQPLFILSGDDAQTGFVDKIYSLLQENLPQYQHENYTSVIARMVRDLKEARAKTICSGILKDRVYDTNTLLSLPVLDMPNFTLQYDKSRQQELEKLTGLSFADGVSLAKLLAADNQIKIGVSGRRSYGKIINHLIRQYPNKFLISADGLSVTDYIQLTKKKRLSFTIEYPIVTEYAYRDVIVTPYESVQITDLVSPLKGYIGCSDTVLGKQVITKINPLIKQYWQH